MKLNAKTDQKLIYKNGHSKETRTLQMSEDIFGLHADNIDVNFLDPYINSGYRKPNISAWNCVKSAFIANSNETANIWTHLLPFIVYCYQFHEVFTSEKFHYSESFNYPLLANAIGILGFLITSAVAHTFNSMSINMRNLCFYLDYAAISIYGVGAGMAFYLYTCPASNSFRNSSSVSIYCFLTVFVSMVATLICCMTRHKWQRYKYALRTFTFVVPFLVGVFPYLSRFLWFNEEIVYDVALVYFVRHVICYIFAAVFNVSKLPEKYFKSKFDLFGQSHHFMHVFVAVGAKLQFDCVIADIGTRKSLFFDDGLDDWRSRGIYVIIIAMILNYGIGVFVGLASSSIKNKKN